MTNLKHACAAATIALAACGGGGESFYESPPTPGPASTNYGYGFEYDYLGPRGLKLRYYRPDIGHPNDSWRNPETFESLFDEVQQCTGLSAPMPFVILLPPGALDPFDAVSYPGLIVMAPLGSGPRAFRHEAIHVVLYHNTGSGGGYFDSNGLFVHTSPLFAQCEGT